jgi:hypothetical protein
VIVIEIELNLQHGLIGYPISPRPAFPGRTELPILPQQRTSQMEEDDGFVTTVPAPEKTRGTPLLQAMALHAGRSASCVSLTPPRDTTTNENLGLTRTPQ